MKFKLLLLVSLVCGANFVFSQTALNDAIEKAKAENKIVMAVVISPDCSQCNEVAKLGISNVESDIINHCVLVDIEKKDVDFSSYADIFTVPIGFFGVIFYDVNKNILDVYHGSRSRGESYTQHIEKALAEKNSDLQSLDALKRAYLLDINNFIIIKNLIDKIQSLNLEPQESLMDELTLNSPPDSGSSLSFLQYVLRCAPLYNSKAFQYLNSNTDNYNMAWYRMSLKERTIINNRIRSKSLNKAIQNKDVNYAYQVAARVQQTYTNTNKPEEGQEAYQQVLLDYYKGANDTANYLKNVVQFYDRFYMTISPDKIKQQDSIQLLKTISEAPVLDNSIINKTDTSFIRSFRKRVTFYPSAQYYAKALNDGAWTIYKYTNNATYLTKALVWVKQAMNFSVTPGVMDTYGRLLYITNNKEEAIIWEKKAIEKKKEQNLTALEYERVLKMMQDNSEKLPEAF